MKEKFDYELHCGYNTAAEKIEIVFLANGKPVTEPHLLPDQDFARLLMMCTSLDNQLYEALAKRHDNLGNMTIRGGEKFKA